MHWIMTAPSFVIHQCVIFISSVNGSEQLAFHTNLQWSVAALESLKARLT